MNTPRQMLVPTHGATRATSFRRRVLNEISRLRVESPTVEAEGDSEQSSSFIVIAQDDFADNVSNIMNNSNTSIRSSAEEQVIQGRGRKKRKSAPSLRDLSPKSLATLQSPMKRPVNEDLAYFLRSPTPKKSALETEDSSSYRSPRKRTSDSILEARLKRTRKSLDVELSSSLLSTDSPQASSSVAASSTPVLTNSTPEVVFATPNTSRILNKNSLLSSNGARRSSAGSSGGRKKGKVNSPIWRNSPRKNLRRSTNVAN